MEKPTAGTPSLDEKKIQAVGVATSVLLQKYQKWVKAIWLFGSVAKGGSKPTSDADMLIVIDDTLPDYTFNIVNEIGDASAKVAEAVSKETGVQIHIQQPKPLSELWDIIKSGEPWIIDSIRTAIPIYDYYNFFKPLQRLLQVGKLPGTIERTEALIRRAPMRLNEIRRIFLQDVVNQLLFTTVEAAQALLMLVDVLPPAPSRVATALRDNFVKEKLLDSKYADFAEQLYQTYRKISHGEITTISGEEIDRLIAQSDEFVNAVEKLFIEIYGIKKKEAILSFRKELLSSCKSILDKLHQRPKTDDQVLPYFERYVIRPGLLPKEYYDVAGKIDQALKHVKSGDVNKIPEGHVYEIELDLRELSAAVDTIVRERAKKRVKG